VELVDGLLEFVRKGGSKIARLGCEEGDGIVAPVVARPFSTR
jgi:hypothetical protein